MPIGNDGDHTASVQYNELQKYCTTLARKNQPLRRNLPGQPHENSTYISNKYTWFVDKTII